MKSDLKKILKEHEIKLIVTSVKVEMILDILDKMNFIDKKEFNKALQPGIDKLKAKFDEIDDDDIDTHLKYIKMFGKMGEA